MQPDSGQGSPIEKNELARHLDSIAWAAFFIWIGIAMLAGIRWGWFLVGLGVVILAAQLARLHMNVKLEGFWVACGAVFLIGGLWTVLNIASWPFGPIVLILLGVVLLGRALSASSADLRIFSCSRCSCDFWERRLNGGDCVWLQTTRSQAK